MTEDANNPVVKPRDVAQWMFDELKRRRELYQEDAVGDIQRKFGQEFIYTNSEGGASISKSVLRSFRTITGNDVVWERGAKLWRPRQVPDGPGRQQD